MSAPTKTRRSFTISAFERVESGDKSWWVATVVEDGERVEIHNRYGSWMSDCEGGRLAETRRDVALALVKKRKKMERREGRAEDES